MNKFWSRSTAGLMFATLFLMFGLAYFSPTHAGPQLTGTLPTDANNVGIQAPRLLQFQDATATPIVSPKTSIGTTPQAFVVPTGAVTMIFSGSATIRYGDNSTLDGSAANKGYKLGQASTDQRYACAGVSTIYIAANSGTVTVDFMFEIVR